MWVVAQLAEHRTVTAAREGSNPFDPPKLFGALGKTGRSRLTFNQEIAGSNPARATNSYRNCGREVRHLVVNQADDGSSPFSSAMRQ